MERAEKLQRLEATKRRVPALSASALAGLLQDIEANGLPGLSQRKHVKEATVKALGHEQLWAIVGNQNNPWHQETGSAGICQFLHIAARFICAM